MSSLLEVVRSGFYAQKQIECRSRLISWSHQGRFRTALRLARGLGGNRLLDYGCGDGTFLGLLAEQGQFGGLLVGAELHPSLVEECRTRFSEWNRFRFTLSAHLEHAEPGSFDVIYCMEVLEHVVEPASLLDLFDRLLTPGGVLVVSVPIETGVPVVIKQVVRELAGWRGIGHYPGTTGYTLGELARSVCAGSTQHLVRPRFHNSDGTAFHDHKGFNWRWMRGLVRDRFNLVREDTSPVGWLGPQLGTQRWFIATRRAR
jgi:SAM-dependent methyltransferase